MLIFLICLKVKFVSWIEEKKIPFHTEKRDFPRREKISPKKNFWCVGLIFSSYFQQKNELNFQIQVRNRKLNKSVQIISATESSHSTFINFSRLLFSSHFCDDKIFFSRPPTNPIFFSSSHFFFFFTPFDISIHNINFDISYIFSDSHKKIF